MSFVGDIVEAVGALGHTFLDYLPESVAVALEPQDKSQLLSDAYQDFKTRIELACQIQLLKKSIEDKGILSTKDRIEVLACVCASWILTLNSEENFKKSKELLTEEAEDLLYVSAYMQKENNIVACFVTLFENARTTSQTESLTLTNNIKQALQNLFKEEQKKQEFYKKPFFVIESIFSQLPSMQRLSQIGAGGVA